EWTGQASVRWFFEDVGKNQSTLASATGQLPANQMAVTPLDPTGFGAVTVTVARPMKYRTGPDSFKGAFVNSSHSLNVAVTDLTPPTCGLEVTADGNAAVVYPLENPPHKYPLPKIADVVCQGKLFGTGGNEENLLVEGLELGGLMIIPADRAALHVAKNAVLGMKPLLRDNQQVNEKSVRFGLCEGAVIPPTLVGSANPTELKLAEFKLPEKPYLFIEADDISGNTQVLFIPLMIK
ncbi:MAG TPA: hypothetical protein PKM25_17670, partial [Candidatus Ozemobacteraceae bacterium]|nr:hypothetical protein [Candidatus Ozemobacteraceae bacterium]